MRGIIFVALWYFLIALIPSSSRYPGERFIINRRGYSQSMFIVLSNTLIISEYLPSNCLQSIVILCFMSRLSLSLGGNDTSVEKKIYCFH